LLAFASTASAATVVDRYDMKIDLDPGHARLAVAGEVRFSSPASGTVRLALGRGMIAPSLEFLDGEPVTWSVVDSTDDDFTWAANASRPVTGVRFRYDVTRPPPRFLFYVGDDYAFAGANTHSWYPRRPEARARGTMEFHAPPEWTVVATGVADGTRFRSEFASELWFFASPFFLWNHVDGPVPITVYRVTPGMDGDALARKASRTLGALRDLFGKFPYPAMSVIEVPTAVVEKAGRFNGIGAAGAIAFESSFLREFLLVHVAHELGHQWWGQSLSRANGSVGGDYMLDEAMTEYGALEVFETLEGPAAAEQFRRRDIPRSAGGGNYGAVEYLKLAAAGYDTTLCCLPDRGTSYRLARSKGARAWYALAQSLGPERFHRALRHIAARRAYQNVTWDEVLSDLSHELGPETKDLAREWFERAGAPRWDFTWEQAHGRLRVRITQPAPAYHPELELEIVTINDTHTRRVKLTDVETRLEFAEKDAVLDVRLDPHYRILHWTPEYEAEATALVADTRARLFLQDGRNAEAESLLVRALAEVKQPDLYGATFSFAGTLARFAETRQDWARAAAFSEQAIAAPTRRADLLPFIYLRLARASEMLGHWEKVAFAARAALAADAASGSLAGISAEAERLLGEAQRHGAVR
jgi:hypothetical protein